MKDVLIGIGIIWLIGCVVMIWEYKHPQDLDNAGHNR